MVASTFRNSFIRNLSPETLHRLALHRVDFELGHELEFPGNPLTHLFFVEEGMASMTTTFEDGSQVEVCMFGYEAVIGASGLMGTKQSLNRVYTQIPGYGFSCRLEAARREFALGGVFQSLCLRYVQAQLMQSMQSTGCNSKHSVEQRLARWLLLCADRVDGNSFRLSHELIADMLGSSRSTVSVAAHVLKASNSIAYTRGSSTSLMSRSSKSRHASATTSSKIIWPNTPTTITVWLTNRSPSVSFFSASSGC